MPGPNSRLYSAFTPSAKPVHHTGVPAMTADQILAEIREANLS